MRPLRRALGALVTTAAAAAACATVWLLSVWLGGDGSAAVLATVIALSLARREFATRAEFARSSALLPVIGLGAAAAGWLLVALLLTALAARRRRHWTIRRIKPELSL